MNFIIQTGSTKILFVYKVVDLFFILLGEKSLSSLLEKK